MLVVEMAIGRYGQANPVDSMRSLTSQPAAKKSVDSLVGLALVYPVPSWPFTALWVAGLSVFTGSHDRSVWFHRGKCVAERIQCRT